MAITNTVTVTTNNGLAYARGPLPAPLAFTPNVPGFWIWHRRYQTIDMFGVVRLLSSGDYGYVASISTNYLPDDPIRIGDLLEVNGGLYEITSTLGDNLFVASTTFGVRFLSGTGPGSGFFNSYSISYQRRPNFMRLNANQPITVEANGITFTPLLNGVNYGTGLISAGAYGTAYYIGVSDYAIAAAVKVPSGMLIDVQFTCTLSNAGLTAQANLVTIAQEPTPFAGLYSSISAGNRNTHIINNSIKVGPWPIGSLSLPPFINTPATCRAIYLTWRSRYGGWEVMPFNYDLADRVSASSIGEARQGFNVNSIGNEVTKTLNIATGVLSEVYADWLEDMLGNAVVFVATELATTPNEQLGRQIDFENTQWTPYKIEGNLTRSTANTRSCSFAGAITRVELGRAYRL